MYPATVTHETFQTIRGIGFIAAVVLALALERRARHAPFAASWRVNGGLWVVDGVVTGLACGACACTVALWAASARVGLLNLLPVSSALAVPLTIFALDLVSYGWHRANHRIALLWRLHRVHHSDASFTVSTALRFHPGELLLSLPLRLTAIAIVGAPVFGVAAFEVLFTFANLFEHGNLDLPLKLEERMNRLVVTPALHRLHHSRRPVELDSNFATIFVLWDRWLGTYRPSSSATAIEVGLGNVAAPTSVLGALRLPLRR